jgi:L-fucose mutarotase
MLLGLDPLLSPDLLHALASMGQGDRIAIVDANFPATTLARRLIVLPGADAPALLAAVLSVLPLDTTEPDPAVVMRAAGATEEEPPVVTEFTDRLAARGYAPPVALDRHAFYRAAADAFALVRSGERRLSGSILLTKGAVPPPEAQG